MCELKGRRRELLTLKLEIADDVPGVGVCLVCETITPNNQLLGSPNEDGLETCEACYTGTLLKISKENTDDNTGSKRQDQDTGPLADLEYRW